VCVCVCLCVCVCVCACACVRARAHSDCHTSGQRDDENSCAGITMLCREIPINVAG
jgi:hypothetical protein